MLDLKGMLARERDDLATLAADHVNPAFVRVLRMLVYDKRYVRGQGAYLFDDAGNRYIDCLVGDGTFPCGRKHPVIRDAIKQAIDLELPNLLAMAIPPLSGLFSRALVLIAP